MKVLKPCKEVFEAFVDPQKIMNYWFSSSSERWEQGKTITLKYDEYNALVNIKIFEIEENKKIVFQWGSIGEGNIVTILLKESNQETTIIEVTEEDFACGDEKQIDLMVDNKEGWVYTLTCLKAYLEFGIRELRSALVK